MDVNAGAETNEMYEMGPLTYRQGYVSVSMESYACRAGALMNDRAMVTAYTGTPDHQGNQLFRAWVGAGELPSVLAHWAHALS